LQNIIASGSYTAMFPTVAGCDSIATLYFVLNNAVSTNLTVSAAFEYELPWNPIVTTTGTYTNMYATTDGCDSLVTINVTITGVRLNAKVFLAGAYNISTGKMQDLLRTLNLIPLQTPYGSGDYTIGYGAPGTEFTSASVLSTSGDDAIVDWVYISLRSKNDANIIVASRSALLQRDGDIVDVDGVSPLSFNAPMPDAYFISVKHRNHLGLMSLNNISLGAIPNPTFDFTNTSTPLYSRATPNNNASPLTGPAKIIGGVRAMYAGNCHINNALLQTHRYISYNNLAHSDRTSLLSVTGSTSTINGYSIYDVDMNGYARFNGFNPDRLVILNNCANVGTVVVQEQTPN
jgi:hypothetical protein